MSIGYIMIKEEHETRYKERIGNSGTSFIKWSSRKTLVPKLGTCIDYKVRKNWISSTVCPEIKALRYE